MASLVKFITKLIARMPLSAALAIGGALGWFYGSVIRYHRRDALEALRRSFPEKSEQEIQSITNRMYRNLGMNQFELLRLAGGNLDETNSRITVVGREIVDQALQRGKGVMIMSAHFGNWDFLPMFSVKKGNYPVTIISKAIKNRAINGLWMQMRKQVGVNIIPNHNSAREALRVLRRNELLGFILDQNRPRDAGIFVDFFGRSACTTPGLAMLSAQVQAPVVPVFIHRTADGKHLLQAFPILEPPPDREPETIRKATQEYTRIIEDQVRLHPEQWIWLHRRWKTRPLA